MTAPIKPVTDDVGSGLYRESDLRAFAILRSRKGQGHIAYGNIPFLVVEK